MGIHTHTQLRTHTCASFYNSFDLRHLGAMLNEILDAKSVQAKPQTIFGDKNQPRYWCWTKTGLCRRKLQIRYKLWGL